MGYVVRQEMSMSMSMFFLRINPDNVKVILMLLRLDKLTQSSFRRYKQKVRQVLYQRTTFGIQVFQNMISASGQGFLS